jgi:hypothetical protein
LDGTLQNVDIKLWNYTSGWNKSAGGSARPDRYGLCILLYGVLWTFNSQDEDEADNNDDDEDTSHDDRDGCGIGDEGFLFC